MPEEFEQTHFSSLKNRPVNFWKLVSFVLFFISVTEGYFLMTRNSHPQDVRQVVSSAPQTVLDLLQQPQQLEFDDDGDIPSNPQTDSVSGPEQEDKGSEIWLTFNTTGAMNADIQVKVDEGQILVTSQSKSSGKEDDHSSIHLEFSQSQLFPLPAEADPLGFKIQREPKKFIIIFKKRAALQKRQPHGHPEPVPPEDRTSGTGDYDT